MKSGSAAEAVALKSAAVALATMRSVLDFHISALLSGGLPEPFRKRSFRVGETSVSGKKRNFTKGPPTALKIVVSP